MTIKISLERYTDAASGYMRIAPVIRGESARELQKLALATCADPYPTVELAVDRGRPILSWIGRGSGNPNNSTARIAEVAVGAEWDEPDSSNSARDQVSGPGDVTGMYLLSNMAVMGACYTADIAHRMTGLIVMRPQEYTIPDRVALSLNKIITPDPLFDRPLVVGRGVVVGRGAHEKYTNHEYTLYSFLPSLRKNTGRRPTFRTNALGVAAWANPYLSCYLSSAYSPEAWNHISSGSGTHPSSLMPRDSLDALSSGYGPPHWSEVYHNPSGEPVYMTFMGNGALHPGGATITEALTGAFCMFALRSGFMRNFHVTPAKPGVMILSEMVSNTRKEEKERSYEPEDWRNSRLRRLTSRLLNVRSLHGEHLAKLYSMPLYRDYT